MYKWANGVKGKLFGLFAHLVKNMKRNGRTQREKKGRKKKGRGHEKHLI
jgi:hypothetical protein